MSCTDIIPRNELNLECMTTGRMIVDYTVKCNGKVSDDDLQKIVDPLVNRVETMATLQANKAVDEYQGQINDDQEDELLSKLIADKKAKISELDPYVAVYAYDEDIKQIDMDMLYDLYEDLSMLDPYDGDEADPFFLQIEMEDAGRDINELDNMTKDEINDLDIDMDVDFRSLITITIDSRYATLIKSSATECFRKFYQTTHSLPKTLTYLRFMVSHNLLDWTQSNNVKSLINNIEMLEDVGLIEHQCTSTSASDRPRKRQRSRFDN